MSNKDAIIKIQEELGCSYEEAEQEAINRAAAEGDHLADMAKETEALDNMEKSAE